MEKVSTRRLEGLQMWLQLQAARLGYEVPIFRLLESFSELNSMPRLEAFALPEIFYNEGVVKHPRLLAAQRAYLVTELRSIALGEATLWERHERLLRLQAPEGKEARLAFREFKFKKQLAAATLKLESFMHFQDKKLWELLSGFYQEFLDTPLAYSEQGFSLSQVASSRKSRLRIHRLWRTLYYYESTAATTKLLKRVARHRRKFGALEGEHAPLLEAYDELLTYALLQGIRLPKLSMGG